MELVRAAVAIGVLSCSVSAFYWPDVPPTPENVLRHTLGQGSGASGAPCVDQRLLHCQANFNGFLGISGNLDWRVPLDFYQALLQIYAKNGTQGFLNVCQAYTNFARCLGNTYAACNNPLFYLQHGYSIITAAYYPATIAQLHFQCGGGLETAIYNWQCITRTGSQYNRTIINCNVGYALNSSIDPAHICTYAANDLQCVRAPFQQQCGGPTGWYMCEYTRVGIVSHAPMCSNLRCRVQGGSSEPEQPAPLLDVKEKEKLDPKKNQVDLSAVGDLGPQQAVLQQIAAESLKQEKEQKT